MRTLLLLLFPTALFAQNPGVCSRVLNTAAPGQVISATTASRTPPCQWTNNGGGGGSVSLTATAPIVITPSPTTGTGVISCPTCATGSTSPGGSNTQLQYNNAGAFGGITGATTNGTALTLVAPVLGTPASGTLTNTTGFPVANLAGLGTNVATFLATPSSANLAAALTDETGTSLAVFNTSPLLVTPRMANIRDSNGNIFIDLSAAGSAVDSIRISSASTGNPATVGFAASGTDANINLTISAQGTGDIIFPGSQGDNFIRLVGLGGGSSDLLLSKHNGGDDNRILWLQGGAGQYKWALGTVGDNNFSLNDAVASANVFTVTSNTGILNITANTFTLGGHTCSIVSTVLTCP